MAKDIEYSEKYCDDYFEYRHVILPKSMKSEIPRARLMTEKEWRSKGVTQSRGWMHYMIHQPEPHILLFRRPIGTDPRTGKAAPDWDPPMADLSEEEKKAWLHGPIPSNNAKLTNHKQCQNEMINDENKNSINKNKSYY
eukprot:CAMPEP_0202701538 /NCGR_PEP_ID=MMETSP1385-20130828/14624_1 /ASSEMBLY_ACC=CAM_ASM_000861 /TAXON_ID=933848 /ORGANISM="Elphidium margaritaceum" /LENGTH=138 /DNA_ID=CAMNT_0049358983 /DNA_START=47 /DNA_END=463 /DNA_ORIENTATION=+